MFGLFKKKDRKLDAILGFLEILYSNFPQKLSTLDNHIKVRALLFTYGVLDCYCQASKLTESESKSIFVNLDKYISSTFSMGLNQIMCSENFNLAFKDKFLLNIITTGGQTYNDFASGVSQRGGMAITRFGSLISIWHDIKINENEQILIKSICK